MSDDRLEFLGEEESLKQKYKPEEKDEKKIAASDDEERINRYRFLATKGDLDAQVYLAYIYEKGLYGSKKNIQEAVRLYELAAGGGHVKGDYHLGRLYYNGIDVRKDEQRALKHYEFAAHKGDADAQVMLGYCYQEGVGVKKNAEVAVECYRKAAAQGNAQAQYNLGYCYQEGIGVEKDAKEALHFYKLAAAQGDADAQNNLGIFYEEGIGMEAADAKEAVRFYTLAAQQGLAKAQFNLAGCYKNGIGVPKNDKEMLRYLKLAVEQRNVGAQFAMGYLYERGISVERNIEEAERLYRLAANQGDTRAEIYLDYLSREKITSGGMEKVQLVDGKQAVDSKQKEVKLASSSFSSPSYSASSSSSSSSSFPSSSPLREGKRDEKLKHPLSAASFFSGPEPIQKQFDRKRREILLEIEAPCEDVGKARKKLENKASELDSLYKEFLDKIWISNYQLVDIVGGSRSVDMDALMKEMENQREEDMVKISGSISYLDSSYESPKTEGKHP